MLTFKKKYFLLTILIFVIEVLIALFIRDRFVRPYGGDFLVVILIYCFLRTFINQPPFRLALTSLAFSFAVEFAQYFNVVTLLGLKGNRFAEIVIGTSYSNHDLITYTLGVLLCYFCDHSSK